MKSEEVRNFLVFFVVIFSLSFVSAGVGIVWGSESVLVSEDSEVCLVYKVYNPWLNDTYAEIRLSDELALIADTKSSEIQFIPKLTSSNNAISVEFCFDVPRVYQRDCLIGDNLICKSSCGDEMNVYSGNVEVFELSEDYVLGDYGSGSVTQMSVSAPLSIGVKCVSYDRDWFIVYFLIALVLSIFLLLTILRIRKRKLIVNRRQ